MGACLCDSASSARSFKGHQYLKLLFQSFRFSNSLLTYMVQFIWEVLCVYGGSCTFLVGTFPEPEAGGT